MGDTPERSDLERTQELFDFLQGKVPDGYRIEPSHVPQLTQDQAWKAVWYIQELHWKIPDHIERCHVCRELYDTWSGGDCLDFGDEPYNFCDGCRDGEEYERKRRLQEADAERE
jgi:hypothetical protein